MASSPDFSFATFIVAEAGGNVHAALRLAAQWAARRKRRF
jgi:hypothetical protein